MYNIGCKGKYEIPFVHRTLYYTFGGTVMKATGIVRKVDELGRVVIPIELRRTLNIDIKDALEIFVDKDQIVLKKYEPCCIFCGEYRETRYVKNKLLCQSCIDEIKESK